MPLHDYRCASCGFEFEALVRNTPVSCPECASTQLDRLLSSFAVSSESTRRANLASARRTNAKVAKDKAIAEQESATHHHH